MEKQLLKVRVNYSLDWVYGVSIKQMRKDLDELEKLGVKEVDIEPCDSYGSPSISIEAHIERLETDEEYKARVERYNIECKTKEAKELELFKKLKEKYENQTP